MSNNRARGRRSRSRGDRLTDMAHEICQHCEKNAATIHVTEIIGTQKHQMHLCEACSQILGVQSEMTPPLPRRPMVESRACPQCGITFEEFRAKGRLGCPKDYDVFGDLLTGVLKKAHRGECRHRGRLPGGQTDLTRTHNDRLLTLRRALRDAVGQERYEEAARLRDEIHQLESDGPEQVGSPE